MTFKLDETQVTEQALREAEASAPKPIKLLLVAAANELRDYRVLCEDAALALEEAAKLKVGMMDSQSKADEITRQIRRVLLDTALRMREQLAKVAPNPASIDEVI